MFLISSARDSLRSIAPARATRRIGEMAAVVLASCLAHVFFPVEWVTWENFERIRVGMTTPEVRSLFVGRPDEESEVRGRIVGPKTFLWAAQLGRGAGPSGDDRAYRMELWESPSLSVVAIYDGEGRVACRFTGVGQVREGWMTRALRSARVW